MIPLVPESYHSPARHSSVTIPPTLIPNSPTIPKELVVEQLPSTLHIPKHVKHIFQRWWTRIGEGVRDPGMEMGTFIITVRYDELQAVSSGGSVELCEVPALQVLYVLGDIVVYGLPLLCGHFYVI